MSEIGSIVDTCTITCTIVIIITITHSDLNEKTILILKIKEILKCIIYQLVI